MKWAFRFSFVYTKKLCWYFYKTKERVFFAKKQNVTFFPLEMN